MWSRIHTYGCARDMVILSDDAGQFAVGERARCWVHAERLIQKLDTFTNEHPAAQWRGVAGRQAMAPSARCAI